MAKEDAQKEESQAATYDTFEDYLKLAIKEYYDRGWKNRRAVKSARRWLDLSRKPKSSWVRMQWRKSLTWD